MELNYLVLLDYLSEKVTIIKLTDEQKSKAYDFDNLEDYIETLEDEYNFKLSEINWISLEYLDVERYGFDDTQKIGD